MIPIEKNILVVDEHGNEYEATYPKRAKGLVKNGRARFVSENKICLACPPKIILEDNNVNNGINRQQEKNAEILRETKDKSASETSEIIQKIRAKYDALEKADAEARAAEVEAKAAEIEARADEYDKADVNNTLKYIFEKIDAVINDSKYIISAIEGMQKSDINNDKINALVNIAEAREKTNQMLLHLLENMYYDLNKKAQIRSQEKAMEFVHSIIPDIVGGDLPETLETLNQILDTIRHIGN